jgi:hypothetical protein
MAAVAATPLDLSDPPKTLKLLSIPSVLNFGREPRRPFGASRNGRQSQCARTSSDRLGGGAAPTFADRKLNGASRRQRCGKPTESSRARNDSLGLSPQGKRSDRCRLLGEGNQPCSWYWEQAQGVPCRLLSWEERFPRHFQRGNDTPGRSTGRGHSEVSVAQSSNHRIDGGSSGLTRNSLAATSATENGTTLWFGNLSSSVKLFMKNTVSPPGSNPDIAPSE